MTDSHLTWVEINEDALRHNLRAFRSLVRPGVKLMPIVKSNAYGHGACVVAQCIQETKTADWLGVNSLHEALDLRSAGIAVPILLLGYVPLNRLNEAVRYDLRLTVCNQETVTALERLKPNKKVRLHVKLETGTGRMGLGLAEAKRLAARIQRSRNCVLEGYSTHFANIEDTTDPTYPTGQITRYESMVTALTNAGYPAPITHAACTAAAMIFPQTHRELVRLGIGLYGLWPSREAMVSSRERGVGIELHPVLSWKTRVTQVKTLPAGAYVGYGCTFRATRKTRLAILPVGYYDGYDRKLSNTSHVLIRGRRAPIRGRICMNLCMADITDIPGVRVEDEVVLIGTQRKERITAEHLASLVGTINYEVVSRINPVHPRVLV